jgi:ketosteroid isomerase-like protein
MMANRRTVTKYMDAFGVNDHGRIFACLADDVEWVVPGAFYVQGKDAFDRQEAASRHVRRLRDARGPDPQADPLPHAARVLSPASGSTRA